MFSYVPPDGTMLPLVVVLHGSMQSAEDYAIGSGWLSLAEESGLALLCPEQRRSNHPFACFNWYRQEDTDREQGESWSIIEMIRKLTENHNIDQDRIFVTGLSAGGAMANALLAVYPDVFAAGAVIAGLPFGAATDVHEALRSMSAAAKKSSKQWGEYVRKAFPRQGPWPKISIWHGSADKTVDVSNAREMTKQWIDVHGLSKCAQARERGTVFDRRVWCDEQGEPMVERYDIAGMNHGLPLGSGHSGGGRIGEYFLDVGLSSSRLIAKFWKLQECGSAP